MLYALKKFRWPFFATSHFFVFITIRYNDFEKTKMVLLSAMDATWITVIKAIIECPFSAITSDQ